jgi:hypothetical protein
MKHALAVTALIDNYNDAAGTVQRSPGSCE